MLVLFSMQLTLGDKPLYNRDSGAPSPEDLFQMQTLMQGELRPHFKQVPQQC